MIVSFRPLTMNHVRNARPYRPFSCGVVHKMISNGEESLMDRRDRFCYQLRACDEGQYVSKVSRILNGDCAWTPFEVYGLLEPWGKIRDCRIRVQIRSYQEETGWSSWSHAWIKVCRNGELGPVGDEYRYVFEGSS